MIGRAMVAAIRFYKKHISPHLGQNCRFTPTCSEYAMQAIQVHGAAKGGLLQPFWEIRVRPRA